MFLWAEHHHFNREDPLQTRAEHECANKFTTQTLKVQNIFCLFIFCLMISTKVMQFQILFMTATFSLTHLFVIVVPNQPVEDAQWRDRARWELWVLQDTPLHHHPCYGIRRHGEVQPPAAIVNCGKAERAGCSGASIPPETQGRASLWS